MSLNLHSHLTYNITLLFKNKHFAFSFIPVLRYSVVGNMFTLRKMSKFFGFSVFYPCFTAENDLVFHSVLYYMFAYTTGTRLFQCGQGAHVLRSHSW